MSRVSIIQGLIPIAATPAQRQQRIDGADRARRITSDDPVPGLLNREDFRAQLGLAIAAAKQQHKQVGLLLLDLDNLTSVIERLGPAIGDELCRQVASRVLGCLRKSDTAGCFIHEELLVLLPEVAGEQGVSELVVHLHRSLVATYTVDGYNIALTVSIGVAVYPNEGSIREDLTKHSCMYLSSIHNRDSRYLLQRMALSPDHAPGRLL